MKRNVLIALVPALLLAALTLVFASCSNGGGAPAQSDETDAPAITLPKEDPTVVVSNELDKALAEYYALKEGDLSQLGKYWYGTVSEQITAEGAKMESAIYGWRLYHYAAPIVMTEERWNEMWAEADEKYADDSAFEFFRVKIEGFYVMSGTNYVLDTAASPARLEELGGYFEEYFGYTIEDVRDAAREAGMQDADEIGTVDPYFVFEYSDRGDIVSSVEYSDEALERLEALCRELKDENGEPFRYGKYDYVPIGSQFASGAKYYRMLLDEYQKCTGDELLGIYKITLRERKIGETSAATGEYREYPLEERTPTVFDVIFVQTSRGWEAETIAFPWGGSARRVLLNYSAAFED
ncbi:MAG: hypothetical protein IKI03_09555 [Clostridia bacterium]|nr:hypothetical protein [Clostridia bacterium]